MMSVHKYKKIAVIHYLLIRHASHRQRNIRISRSFTSQQVLFNPILNRDWFKYIPLLYFPPSISHYPILANWPSTCGHPSKTTLSPARPYKPIAGQVHQISCESKLLPAHLVLISRKFQKSFQRFWNLQHFNVMHHWFHHSLPYPGATQHL